VFNPLTGYCIFVLVFLCSVCICYVVNKIYLFTYLLKFISASFRANICWSEYHIMISYIVCFIVSYNICNVYVNFIAICLLWATVRAWYMPSCPVHVSFYHFYCLYYCIFERNKWRWTYPQHCIYIALPTSDGGNLFLVFCWNWRFTEGSLKVTYSVSVARFLCCAIVNLSVVCCHWDYCTVLYNVPGDRVTMLLPSAQQTPSDDVTASADQSDAVIVGQCDVTLSRAVDTF